MSVEPRFAYSTAVAAIDRIFEKQQARCRQIANTTAAQRKQKIRRLHNALLERRAEIHQVLWDDYRKPAPEIDLSEIYPVVAEARHATRRLRKWMRPQRVPAPLALVGSRSRIVYEPKGVALIISPWNFPINLSLGPLISAIAAGNTAILKPSEMTPHTSSWMRRLISDLFDESEVAVIEGDAAVAEALLKKKFDHIFFTGSPAVGKIVMRAAAENLTSVTLELGGKSPAIVDRTADLDEAAKKIAWGKSLNAGQVCIAPDYVLVDETVRAPLVEKLRAQPVYETSWLLKERRSVPTTLVENPSPDSPLLRQEIFGPFLPVIGYRDLDEALRMITARERPLVLYLFSRERSVIDRVLRQTRAGGTVINDTLVHFYQLNLPFGGVGESGFGKAHGRFGFEAFSNARAVLEQPTRCSVIQLLYPPYTAYKRKLIDLALRYF